MVYNAEDIKQAVHEVSLGLTNGKKGCFENYIDRTVERGAMIQTCASPLNSVGSGIFPGAFPCKSFYQT